MARGGPSPPKSLQRALNQLKKNDDIVITKPDKGTVVVVINKRDYIHLLREALIDNEEKFKSVSLNQPNTRGRPFKNYHPLLEKEELEKAVPKILPENVAKIVYQKGSRFAHLYVLPKTHKSKLSISPTLSAVGAYNEILVSYDITLIKLSTIPIQWETLRASGRRCNGFSPWSTNMESHSCLK